MLKSETLHKLLLYSYIPILIWSVLSPADYLIWFLEVGPAIIGGLILIVFYKRFRLTSVTYALIWVSAVTMAIGGHYTYEQVPPFDWIREPFGFERNHFDRLGHFIKGLMLALLGRELLLRTSPLQPGKWLLVIVVSMATMIAAGYELVEWVAALVITGETANEFLGMQGDEWDAQWDIAVTMGGALLSYLLFRRLHDRQLCRVEADLHES